MNTNGIPKAVTKIQVHSFSLGKSTRFEASIVSMLINSEYSFVTRFWLTDTHDGKESTRRAAVDSKTSNLPRFPCFLSILFIYYYFCLLHNSFDFVVSKLSFCIIPFRNYLCILS